MSMTDEQYQKWFGERLMVSLMAPVRVMGTNGNVVRLGNMTMKVQLPEMDTIVIIKRSDGPKSPVVAKPK